MFSKKSVKNEIWSMESQGILFYQESGNPAGTPCAIFRVLYILYAGDTCLIVVRGLLLVVFFVGC